MSRILRREDFTVGKGKTKLTAIHSTKPKQCNAGIVKDLKTPPTLRIATSLSCACLTLCILDTFFSADLSKTATDGAFFKHSNLSLLGEEKEVCLPCTKLFWCYTVLHTLVTDKQHCLLKLKDACSESRKLIL